MSKIPPPEKKPDLEPDEKEVLPKVDYGLCFEKDCKKKIETPHKCPYECGALLCSPECVEKHSGRGYIRHWGLKKNKVV